MYIEDTYIEDTYFHGVCLDCGCYLSDCICDIVTDDIDEYDDFVSAADFIAEHSSEDRVISFDRKNNSTSHNEFKDYESLAEKFIEFVDYEINVLDVHSSLSVIAPHGGKIEPGTSELSKYIALDEYNFYSFTGYSEHNKYLHITSHNFDEPVCVSLVKKSSTVISIHGCKGRDSKIYIGGLDVRLKYKINARLISNGYDSSCRDHKFQAKFKSNICNRGYRGKGVQIELSRDLRDNDDVIQDVARIIRDVLATHKY